MEITRLRVAYLGEWPSRTAFRIRRKKAPQLSADIWIWIAPHIGAVGYDDGWINRALPHQRIVTGHAAVNCRRRRRERGCRKSHQGRSYDDPDYHTLLGVRATCDARRRHVGICCWQASEARANVNMRVITRP